MVWLGFAVVCTVVLFLGSSRTVTVASHDAIVSPTLSGRVVLTTGPVLPDLRIDSGLPFGVEVQLGKTDVGSTEELVQRYAFIASQPEGPVTKVEAAVEDMAVAAAMRGAVLGFAPLLLWWVVGPVRRRELPRRLLSRKGVAGGLVLVLAGVVLWAPWEPDAETVESERSWIPLQEFIGPEVTVPEEVRGAEILSSATTVEVRRLVQSAVDTYDRSLRFYETAAENALDVELRTPEEGETVVALVSDRHDNIGMDAVARALADQAGATAVFDAGDDTSTGSPWEGFSLDSLDAAFKDLDGRWAVAGNHDHGDFVGAYLADLGWTMLDGEVVDGPGGSRLLGVPDPRSSGLGTWRDEGGLSFAEVGTRLADAACAADEEGDRVTTILVHDPNLGDEALERGCTDLVVGGHLHVQEGPTAVVGDDDVVGYSYTTGTTGGAAYAIAIGSKLRRAAQVSLLTYDDEGRPVGIQPVLLQTNGRFDVGDYVELTYEAPDEEVDGAPEEETGSGPDPAIGPTPDPLSRPAGRAGSRAGSRATSPPPDPRSWRRS